MHAADYNPPHPLPATAEGSAEPNMNAPGPDDGAARVHTTAQAAPDFHHVPVLLEAVLAHVPENPTLLVDCTLGGGGHAEALLRAHPQAQMFGSDRDPRAVTAAQERLAPFAERTLLRRLAFADLPHQLLPHSVDFILADLGVSSYQLDAAGRGFSFNDEGYLSMRMDAQSGAALAGASDAPSGGKPGGKSSGKRARAKLQNPDTVDAALLLAELSRPELVRLLRDYGEERYATAIAQAIEGARELAPIDTARRLASIINAAVPAKYRYGRLHPATRTFQALRMAVNDEPGQLNRLLEAAPALLRPGGRIAVISFHSLEDRPVKEHFRGWETPCVCSPHMPTCVCGLKPLGRRVTRKPLTASPEEVQDNPRSRSAKLRVFEMAPAGTSPTHKVGRGGP